MPIVRVVAPTACPTPLANIAGKEHELSNNADPDKIATMTGSRKQRVAFMVVEWGKNC